MKSKLKTSLLAILLTLFTVCTLLFCVQAFSIGNIAKADIQPTGTQGDTHVTLAADKTTVSKGGSVTFTITVTPSAERQTLEWYSINLDLTPLNDDMQKGNTDLYQYLSGTDVKLNDTGYIDQSMSKLVTNGFGYMFGYGWNTTSGLPPRVANTPVVKKITITISDSLPDSVTSMTWGFAFNASEKVAYSKDGVKSAGKEDRTKKATTTGQLTYEPVTLNIGAEPKSTACDLTALQVGRGSTVNTNVTPISENMTYDLKATTASVTDFKVKPTISDKATLKIGTTPTPATTLASGATSANLTVTNGTKIYFEVTAEDGTTKKTYTLTVNLKNDDTGVNITATGVTTGKSYTATKSGATFTFTLDGDEKCKLTITPTGTNASVTVGGATYNANTEYGTGNQTVRVTAESGTGANYTVTINKKQSADTGVTISATGVTSGNTYTPTISGSTYTVTLNGEDKCKLTITPTDSKSSVTVNGSAYNANTEHGVGTVTVVVTAENSAKATYTVKIEAPAASASLTTLKYAFGAGQPASTAACTDVFTDAAYNSSTKTFNITKDISEVPVNNKVYFFAEASFGCNIAPTGLTKSGNYYEAALKFGTNTFELNVTGQGTAKYTLIVNLVEDKNNITNIELTLGGSPVSGFTFNAATNSYDISVPYSGQAANVKVTTDGFYTYVYKDADTNRLVRNDTDRTHTGTINLKEGGTTTVVYYAKSNNGTGAEGTRYTLNIAMAERDPGYIPSDNFDISGITITGADGTQYFPGEYGENGVSIVFDKDTHSYKLVLPHDVEHVTVTVNKADPTAKVSGDGVVDLMPGNNEFEVYAESESGLNKDGAVKYTFQIERKIPVETVYLSNLQIDGTTVSGFNKNTFDYFSYQSSTTNRVTLTATAENPEAEVAIKVNGVTVQSGIGSVTGAVNMAGIGNQVNVTIEATLDGTTTEYTLGLMNASDVPLLTYLYVNGYEILDADGNVIKGSPETEGDVLTEDELYTLGHTKDFYVTIYNDTELFIEARTADATAELRVDEKLGFGMFDMASLFGDKLTADLHVVIRPLIGADSVYTIHLKRAFAPTSNTNAEIIIDEIKEFNTAYNEHGDLVCGTYRIPYSLDELTITVIPELENEFQNPATYKIFYNYKLKNDNGENVSNDTLHFGYNLVHIEITATDGVTKKIVVVVVYREEVSFEIINIQEIAQFEKEYKDGFTSGKNDFYYDVESNVDHLTLLIRPQQGYYCEVYINGSLYESEFAGLQDWMYIQLQDGMNEISIRLYPNEVTGRATAGYMLTALSYGTADKNPTRTVSIYVHRAEGDSSLVWIILFFILLLIVIIETIVIICMIPRLRKEKQPLPPVAAPVVAPLALPAALPMYTTPAASPVYTTPVYQSPVYQAPVYQSVVQPAYVQPQYVQPTIVPPVMQQPVVHQPIIQAVPQQQRYNQQPVNVEVRLNGFNNDDDGFYDQYGRKY